MTDLGIRCGVGYLRRLHVLVAIADPVWQIGLSGPTSSWQAPTLPALPERSSAQDRRHARISGGHRPLVRRAFADAPQVIAKVWERT